MVISSQNLEFRGRKIMSQEYTASERAVLDFASKGVMQAWEIIALVATEGESRVGFLNKLAKNGYNLHTPPSILAGEGNVTGVKTILATENYVQGTGAGLQSAFAAATRSGKPEVVALVQQAL